MPSLSTVMLIALGIYTACRFIIFPFLAWACSDVTLASIKLTSTHGIEWRPTDHALPLLRIEKAEWRWGGKKEAEVGWFVIGIKGVSLRVDQIRDWRDGKGRRSQRHSEEQRNEDQENTKKGPGFAKRFGQRVASWLLYTVINHNPMIARIISIHLSDIRIISDDLAGLEVVMKDMKLGTAINFGGKVDLPPTGIMSPPMSPMMNSPRPFSAFSPPASPSVFLYPNPLAAAVPVDGSETDEPSPASFSRFARLSQAKRKAGAGYHRVSSTAAQIFSRATARAHGSISANVAISDISVILPHSGAIPPSPPENLSRPSSTSLKAFPLFRRRSTAPTSSSADEVGFTTIASITGVSHAHVDLAFGPKKALWEEDTIKAGLRLAVLDVRLDGLQRVRALLKSKPKRKANVSKAQNTSLWSTSSWPRSIMRSIEQASISLDKASLTQHFPKVASRSPSASSSATDLTAADLPSPSPTDQGDFVISLEIMYLAITLTAADSSNNDFARKTFGINQAIESRVRGIGFVAQWDGVAIQNLSPGDGVNDKTQLLAVRQAQLAGLSTWRPTGWSREELLFADDPNISLLIGNCAIASVDVSADLQLVDELRLAVMADHTHSENDVKVDESAVDASDKSLTESLTNQPFNPTPCLPPRLRFVLDVGHIMIVASDIVGDQRLTLLTESAGCHIGCFTSFEDIVARRGIAVQRKAFEDEASLFRRRETAGRDFNAALSPSMHRPQHRRLHVRPATLPDDHSFRMSIDTNAEIEPTHSHLSIERPGSNTAKMHELATIGKIHSSVYTSLLGIVNISDNGSDEPALDLTSRSIEVNVGISGGIQANLSDPRVVGALVSMGERRDCSSTPSSPQPVSPSKNVFDKLPHGISVRFSLGKLSAIVGHVDPNPNCSLKLVKGLWVQTNVLLEYAYFTRIAQYPRDRLRIQASFQRSGLRLGEVISTQAIAYSEKMRDKDGRAALTVVSLHGTFIKPVYNAVTFTQAGGLCYSLEMSRAWKKKTDRKKGEPRLKEEDDMDSTPRQPSTVHQVLRPLVRCSDFVANVMLLQSSPELPLAVKVTSKLSRPVIHIDLSHIYCALLASLTLKQLKSAWSRPSTLPTSSTRTLIDISARVEMPALTIHVIFPIQEQLILHFGGIEINKIPHQGAVASVARMMAYVQSLQNKGEWEELARVRELRVAIPLVHHESMKQITVDAECFRLRIAPRYKLSDLILDINVSIKALETLSRNIKGGEFLTRHEPEREEPKRPPFIRFAIKRIAIEALDDPLELKLNLIYRIGAVEQQSRIRLEDAFQAKLELLQSLAEGSSEEELLAARSKLTRNARISPEEARVALDQREAASWIQRHREGVLEIREEEQERRRPFHIATSNSDGQLRIKIVERPPAPPLCRTIMGDFKLDVSALSWSMDEIVQYLSDSSASPFDQDVGFSLLIPLNLKWTMSSLTIGLRDYPLPLVRIRSSDPEIPAWSLETPFIIAEEYHGPETWFEVPVPIIPAHLGHENSGGLAIAVCKTISPPKTYTQPIIKIQSTHTSEFAWANSYQPTIQDMMRVIDTITSTPRDPSDKPGFWDKFRLTLHWKVQLDFTGPVHLHGKGSSNPYCITGHGAGHAFAWRHGSRFRIGYPNDQHELIQAESEELMVVIPDLMANDHGEELGHGLDDQGLEIGDGESQRQYIKPCARFVGGIRIGFGFRFERTCRPWNCTEGCGNTSHLARRKCRHFDFKRHQDVILRNREAVKEEEEKLDHLSDSFEGFRSDYIHFSVSCVSTRPDDSTSDKNMSSIHLSPKAFAHFFAWWALFDSHTSIPTRRGNLWPDSPPPSKKFGKHIGTIKYLLSIDNLSVSHVYGQVVEGLWAAGKSQYLGVKAHIGRAKVDAHQRLQERMVGHEKLNRVQVVPHKPFYSVDAILDDLVIKGVVAEFVEVHVAPNKATTEATGVKPPPKLTRVSDLPEDQKFWYDFGDYIDADRKPIDLNPGFEAIDFAECPHASFGMRTKAKEVSTDDDDLTYRRQSPDVETTKFGTEPTHVCYLGKAPTVAAMQSKISTKRHKELLLELKEMQEHGSEGHKWSERECVKRIASLKKNEEILGRDAEVDDEEGKLGTACESEDAFRLQVHVHCPRIMWDEKARNLVYRYFHSRQDRKREEYTTSYGSLHSVRTGLTRVFRREAQEANAPDPPPEEGSAATGVARWLDKLQKCKEHCRSDALPFDISDAEGVRQSAALGTPPGSTIVAKFDISLFKPQIVMRSEVPDYDGVVGDSVLLVAAEKIEVKSYSVNDSGNEHRAVEQILGRWYISPKALQAFYPTDENIRRSRHIGGAAHGLGYLPYEIFLDEKNEATDYTRILSKTEAAITFDKFNHLRLPRGLEWPEVKDSNGMPVEHLRLHQDLYSITLPRMTVSATSKHYTAMFNIGTSLLAYQDPRHAERARRINKFNLAFDRKDRDLPRTIIDLFHQQQHVVELNRVVASYEAEVAYLTDKDRLELFRLRNEALEEMEQLFTVFEAITVAIKRERARASIFHSSRINLRAGNIAWQMLRGDLGSIVNLDVRETLFSRTTNKDGSNDQALRIQDLGARNSGPDAQFSEVLTRLDIDTAGRGFYDPFVSAAWSVTNPIGGIPIVTEARYFLHPLRISLEERVANQAVDYVFPDLKRRRAEEKERKKRGKYRTNGGGDTADSTSLTRTKSSTSVSSQATGEGRAKGDEKFTMMSPGDAKIMQERADKAMAFNSIELPATVLSLSFKGDPAVKRRVSIPDCADMRVQTPALRYKSKNWSYDELFMAVKKDVVSHAWSQRGNIAKQVVYKTSLFRTKASFGKFANLHSSSSSSSKLSSGSSKLRLHTEENATVVTNTGSPLSRVISRRKSIRHTDNGNGDSSPNHSSPSSSPTSSTRVRNHSGITSSPGTTVASNGYGNGDGEDEEEFSEESGDAEGDGDGHGIGKVKELWGRLGRSIRETREGSNEDSPASGSPNGSERRKPIRSASATSSIHSSHIFALHH